MLMTLQVKKFIFIFNIYYFGVFLMTFLCDTPNI